jgi:hypothetical protein
MNKMKYTEIKKTLDNWGGSPKNTDFKQPLNARESDLNSPNQEEKGVRKVLGILLSFTSSLTVIETIC